MSVFHENMLIGASGQVAAGGISRSLRFNSSDSAFLSRVPSTNGNSNKFTFSAWLKLSKIPTALTSIIGGGASGIEFVIGFNSSAQFFMQEITGGGSTTYYNVTSTAVFRDPSSWYHITVALDTTEATGSNRIKLWVNGSAVQLNFNTTPSLNYSTLFADATYQRGVGAISANHTNYAYLDGYLADVFYVDGQALTPSSFTEVSATTGQLIPKAYTGSYGTNGFKLTFSDNSGTTSTTLGKDAAGSNNWTPNNFSVASGSGNDSLVDTPTSYGTGNSGGDVRGNYCTWNPLDNAGTLANGNLDFSNSASSNQAVRSTFALPESGKWYAEFTTGTLTNGSSGVAFGFANSSASLTAGPSAVNRWTIYADAVGYIFANNSTLTSSLGTFAAGTVLQIAYDAATGKAWVGKNNTWYNSSGGTTGDPAAGTNQTFTLSGTQFLYTLCFANSGVLNAGQRPFAYTAPSGFKALCDTNLPAPVIAKSASAFQAITYTGTGANATIPNVNTVPTSIDFTPDLVWIKGRSGATDHALYDSVRDVQKDLVSNSTAAETTQSTGLTAFGTNTFNIGTLAKLNTSSSTYVGWCWDAGTSTVTNTQGSITSTVRANASAGFSIVTYTGAGSTSSTIGHGLGVAPSFIITKARTTASQVNNWRCYHRSLGATQYLILNATDAAGTFTDWANTAPTSSVFYVGGTNTTFPANESGINYVAYCFAPVAGYSSFGSYTGNGSADGPFVYTGFRPRWVMIKRSDSASASYGWFILDTARNTYNVMNTWLAADNSAADGADIICDTVANGFKIRTTAGNINTNAGTFVYACFAESPFQYARAR